MTVFQLLKAMLLSVLLPVVSYAATISTEKVDSLHINMQRQHNCGIYNGGDGDQIFCWGNNTSGQLGNGTTINSTEPVQVKNIAGTVRMVSTDNSDEDHHHTCAVINEAAWCWGNNDYGQLGDGTRSSSATPVAVKGLEKEVTRISAGSGFSCAVMAESVYCWGRNRDGQLGDNSRKDSLLAVQVEGIKAARGELPGRVVAIGTGDKYACAGVMSGQFWCWGDNTYGQLGNGTRRGSTTPSPVKKIVADDGILVFMSVGYTHTCVIVSETIKSAHLQCWGDNRYGQLGVDGQGKKYSDIPVTAAPMVSNLMGKVYSQEIIAGKHRTCAVNDGSLYCWGNPWSGVEAPSNADNATPLKIPGDYTNVHVGNESICWLDAVIQRETPTGIYVGKVPPKVRGVYSTGKAFCWPYDQSEPVAIPNTGNAAVAQESVKVTGVASGDKHACAIFNGAVWCWGDNEVGQLGAGYVGGQVQTTSLVQAKGLESGVTAISARSKYTCAIAKGAVWCWGMRDNLFPDSKSSDVPRLIEGLEQEVTAIAAGDIASCAIVHGDAWCWGYDGKHQLGTAMDKTNRVSSAIPLLAQNLEEKITAISMSNSAISGGAVAVIAGEQVWFWGDLVSSGSASASAQLVEGLPAKVTAVGIGANHLCAIADKDIWCFGDNTYGQLGNGERGRDQAYKPQVYKPYKVPSIQDPTAIVAGGNRNIAIAGNHIWVWGEWQGDPNKPQLWAEGCQTDAVSFFWGFHIKHDGSLWSGWCDKDSYQISTKNLVFLNKLATH